MKNELKTSLRPILIWQTGRLRCGSLTGKKQFTYRVQVTGSSQALDQGQKRIAIASPPGCGKTTLGRKLATLFDLACVETGALFHAENWVPRETFEQEIVEFAAQPNWVTEWQYTAARPNLLARANIVVCLD